MVNYPIPDLDGVFRALADPTRRAIIGALARGPKTVSEISRPFDISLPAVSKHLKVLERARLVRRRRVWREHRVSFNAEPLDEVSTWIEKRRAFWTQRLDALDALLKAEDAEAANQPGPVK